MHQYKASGTSTMSGQIACLIAIALSAGSTADAEPFAYLTATGDDAITVIDTATNTVIDTIDVGGYPNHVTAHPMEDRAYVSNTDTDSIVVLDTSTNTVVNNIAVGPYPSGLAVHPAGHTLYVVDWETETLYLIDTATDTVIDNVVLFQLSRSVQIDVHPLGTKVYVAAGNGRLAVVDTATLDYELTTPGSLVNYFYGGLTDVIVEPNGNRFFASTLGGFDSDPDPFDNWLWVFSTTNNRAIARIPFGDSIPQALAVDPRGRNLYISTLTSDSPDAVYVFNLTSLSVTDVIPVGEWPVGLEVHPDGRTVYTANSDLFPGDVSPDTVSVIDTATNLVVDTIEVGNTPIELVIAPPPVIGGQVEGMNLGRVYCRNQTTDDTVLVQIPPGVDQWNCAAVGMYIQDADSIRSYLRGTAIGAGLLNVSLEGLSGTVGICRNNVTNQTVIEALGGGTDFDCLAMGLTVDPGDEVLLIGYAKALAP